MSSRAEDSPPACIRRVIDGWPPSGLTTEKKIDNLARTIWLALLAEGEVEYRFEAALGGYKRAFLVLPLVVGEPPNDPPDLGDPNEKLYRYGKTDAERGGARDDQHA